MSKRPLVVVVDDDESVRESLPDLLWELGFEPRAFSSVDEFLGSDLVEQANCLILDVAMPGRGGPELQQELVVRRPELPIVFITAHRDETLRFRLLGRGAIACLYKPFSESDLLKAIQTALGIGS
jgi:FixJ family two-component response regulator